MRLRLSAVAAALIVLALGACESTQSKSAALKAKGGKSFSEQGLDVTQRNREVEVVEKQVLQDENGTAVVVVLRSRATAPLRGVPVEIQVTGAGAKVLFKNDQPGIDPALVGPALLPPGKEFAWVNDQVVAEGKATAVKVTPGAAKGKVQGQVPRLEVSEPHLQGDPVSGIQATGTVTNQSDVEQKDLVLFCVARRDGKIVAAGRGAIPRLKARKKLPYHIFFIGSPRAAKLSIEAPPTELEAG
jgi:hypothetical protein